MGRRWGKVYREVQTDEKNVCFQSFELKDFVNSCDAAGIDFEGSYFEGPYNAKQAMQKARYGDDSLVKVVEKYMDKIPNLHPDVKAFEWISSVAGAYPCVPEYLADYPTSMRARRKNVRDNAPLNIYVSTTSSASVSETDLLNRGAAVAALLMQLERVRPVSVSVLVELGGRNDYIASIRIPSQPLNIGQLAFALCSASFSRGLTYKYAELFGSQGAWPSKHYKLGGSAGDARYINWLRTVVDANDYDIFVPTAHTYNISSDPIAWIEKMLIETLGKEEE